MAATVLPEQPVSGFAVFIFCLNELYPRWLLCYQCDFDSKLTELANATHALRPFAAVAQDH
jgi:hypothetical protein